ncbi:recombinase, partial [Rhizobium grahamii CCGE 502]
RVTIPQRRDLRMRHFRLQARQRTNEDAKRQMMPTVRSFINKVVIGTPRGHQPATLEAYGLMHCSGAY